jgi:hypothetical protein
VENETIEIVMGHARRSRALPGRSTQFSDVDAGNNMTLHEEAFAFAENEKGSWVVNRGARSGE